MSTSKPPPSSGDFGYGTPWSFSSEDVASEPPPRPSRPRRGPRRPSRPDLDPRSNRLLQLAGVLSILLIAVVVNAALHSDGDPLNPVAEAAQRTEQAPGARLAFEVTYTSPGLTATIVGHGSGAYNARTGRTRMELSASVPGRGTETVSGVGDDRTLFMRSPTISASLPPGKSWLAMQPFLGHSTQTFGSGGNAKSSLEMLEAAGAGVEEKGKATIRGHLTTVYAGTIHLDRVPELLEKRGETAVAREYEQVAKLEPAPIPVEVWVDEKGLARRLRIVQQLPSSAGAPALTMDMKMELFDFGARPRVDLPPPRASLDVTPLVRAELHLLNGETLASSTAPSRRAPMSATEFRRRGNAICRDARQEVHAISRRYSAFARGREPLSDGSSPQERLAWLRPFGSLVYRPAAALARRAAGRLAKLSPPAGDAARFHAVLHGLSVSSEIFSAQAVALEVGAVPVWKELERGSKSRTRREDQLAREIGLTACGGPHDTGAAFHSEASIE